MVRWGATNGVSIHPKKTDVMHFSRSKLRTAPPAIVPNPCREVGGKSEGSGLPPTSTHQYETRSAAECCPKRRQGVSRASPALRLRSVVPRHDKAAMEPAYQRPAIEQPASHTEKEQGLEPVHETYTAPLEDDTHRRPPPGKLDTASYPGPRSAATQVLHTTQVA
ncbi:hypothetical protein HZ326_28701 [Fusarium oxysporum f. sp. albedinis]|nr:hypothetical protein HZ326_28701 [Fusarium oxysporum f. sp. albedinis]